MIYMGLVKYPCIEDYWNGSDLYINELVRGSMSRNRNELLLSNIHFSNNIEDIKNKLFKVQPAIDNIVENYKKYRTPGRDISIDEFIITFQGRLSFKQYISNKSYRFGIKLFKICDNYGYSYNFII